MSDGARHSPGRRATDAERHLEQITRELARIERENDLLRCQKRDAAEEVATLIRTVRKAALEALEAQNEIIRLNALVRVEQSLRTKVEKRLATYDRRITQNTETA